MQLEVFLNGTSTQLVGAFVEQPDGQLAATRKELMEVGVKPPGTGGGEDTIVLDEVPGLVYRYDEPRQRIELVVPDDRRMPHVVDARGEAPAPVGTAQAGYGAVLNYTLYGAGVKGVEAEMELAFSGIHNFLVTAMLAPTLWFGIFWGPLLSCTSFGINFLVSLPQ